MDVAKFQPTQFPVCHAVDGDLPGSNALDLLHSRLFGVVAPQQNFFRSLWDNLFHRYLHVLTPFPVKNIAQNARLFHDGCGKL